MKNPVIINYLIESEKFDSCLKSVKINKNAIDKLIEIANKELKKAVSNGDVPSRDAFIISYLNLLVSSIASEDLQVKTSAIMLLFGLVKRSFDIIEDERTTVE